MLNLSRDSNNSLTSANLWFHLFRLGILPLLPPEPRVEQLPPVVIGAHGGSGTRVLAQALHLAGIWMGRWRNPRTEDGLATRFFLQRHFDQAMAIGGEPHSEQASKQRVELEHRFLRMIRAHRFGMPDPTAAWGWKNPRSMWVIPFLAGLYPGLRFIHLVRDGRDLALSSNRNLLRKHGAALLRESGLPADPLAAQLQLWSLGNRRAATDGVHWLGAGYLHVSYEAFCTHPRDTLEHIYRHLGYAVTDAALERGARLVAPPQSIGAWQATDAQALHEPPAEVADSLRQFGYRG
ncbi:sulfotransferase family protein [Rhabdochromatium marinum]|uniref:sulfotransferase family protein n=1 Tax=Rhabdochromatium marinum TaxID=48729 RepID=UPI0019082CE2|nr:sulfotransferase [Rhabdochromatium marinum]MBK1649696.1 hypothetical protein [Rhabdochromatium marinum]